MAQFHLKMAANVQAANTAHALLEGALAEFNSYVAAYNWVAAEEARLRVVANTEAYLDAMAAIYKTQQGY